jgi:hypothetical protein
VPAQKSVLLIDNFPRFYHPESHIHGVNVNVNFIVILRQTALKWYLLDGSGGPELLVEQDVLASGSLSGFLLGKHYNRCKRLHPLLALAFQILHFQRFCEQTEIPDIMERFVEDSLSEESLSALEESPAYQTFMTQYKAYMGQTLSREHGTTA